MKASKKQAKVTFSSDTGGAAFECSLDGKAFSGCSSPLKLKRLKPGKHVFRVRAVAGGVADASPAQRAIKVKKSKRR